jgi:membrane protein implicated in regulation of membrane protease activity
VIRSRRAPTSRVLARYVRLQIPGWILLGAGLFAAVRWWSLSLPVAVAIFAFWVVKDAALFPLVRRAYEPDGTSGPETLVADEGVAEDTLDPAGYVRVGAELWRAECADPRAAPIPRGSPVRVLGVRNLTLLVEHDGGDVPTRSQPGGHP